MKQQESNLELRDNASTDDFWLLQMPKLNCGLPLWSQSLSGQWTTQQLHEPVDSLGVFKIFSYDVFVTVWWFYSHIMCLFQPISLSRNDVITKLMGALRIFQCGLVSSNATRCGSRLSCSIFFKFGKYLAGAVPMSWSSNIKPWKLLWTSAVDICYGYLLWTSAIN